MLTNNFSQPFEAQYLCDICSEAVTNPICPSCLTSEIEAWLTLYPDLRQELLHKLYDYLDMIDNKPSDSTRCIKCKSNAVAVCPYCFTWKVLNELKNIKANKIILKEFLDFFNYDFEHLDFWQEAEKMGVV